MKKSGYTLSEALIALGIVGVVAALMLPMANKFKPDQEKVLYLKTYDSLAHAVNSIAGATKLYNPNVSFDDTNTNYNVQNYPLFDTYTNKTLNGINCGNGVEAFGKLLNVAFGGDGKSSTFKLKNGTEISVKPSTDDAHVLKQTSNDNVELYYEITVDIDGSNKGPNSFYNSDTNEKPDKFSFFVTPNGALTPADQYGQMYIATRSSWKNNASSDPTKYNKRTTANNSVKDGIPEFKIPTSNLDKQTVASYTPAVAAVLDTPKLSEPGEVPPPPPPPNNGNSSSGTDNSKIVLPPLQGGQGRFEPISPVVGLIPDTPNGGVVGGGGSSGGGSGSVTTPVTSPGTGSGLTVGSFTPVQPENNLVLDTPGGNTGSGGSYTPITTPSTGSTGGSIGAGRLTIEDGVDLEPDNPAGGKGLVGGATGSISGGSTGKNLSVDNVTSGTYNNLTQFTTDTSCVWR